MYTVYIIDRADTVDCREKRPFVVKGDISTVRVHANGQTVHDRWQVRRVVVPRYYTEADIYLNELRRIAGMVVEPPVQQGFPERLEP